MKTIEKCIAKLLAYYDAVNREKEVEVPS